MRDASQWTVELLQAVRNNPAQVQELIMKIQTDAKMDGYNEAMTLATRMAVNCMALLDIDTDRQVA